MRRPLALAFLLFSTTATTRSVQARTLTEYKQYRALSIDLLGRMPTRDELAAFESPEFDLDRWIDQQLDARGYADRLSRVWMDVLRLELAPVLQLRPASTVLRRVSIQGPDGKAQYVYFRPGQRRTREATDGDFCLTKDESGVQAPNNKPQIGLATKVKQSVLDANTVLVRPWWLYRDYRNAMPVLHYGTTWTTPDAGFEPASDLLVDADGTKVTTVRVCKEEALASDKGTVYVSGRKPNKGPPPFDRLKPLPIDDAWAKQHAGQAIACRSTAAHTVATDCGCGVGLERCMPWESTKKKGDTAFVSASRVGLGVDQPFDRVEQSPSEWSKLWLAQEAAHYLTRVFKEDRDFRELLTSKGTWVNGPLAQFYKSSTGGSIGKGKAYGLIDEGEPLFDPDKVPLGLLPHDLTTWERVDDRGPRAAGLLTTPVFLEKYATRRARGAALYSAFLCKSFVAGANVKLTPSNDPNLMTRPGCATCHGTLEPLAAWFSRVGEGDYRWLPASAVPTENPKCKVDAFGKPAAFCRDHYDPAFSTVDFGLLRGAYASREHAEAGPVGVAEELAKSGDLATCAVERVASSFLGRALTNEDAALVASLREVLTSNGYRTRPVVRALVKSKAYREANDLASDVWRNQ